MENEIENNDSTNVETDQTEILETTPEEVLDDVKVETLEDAEALKEKNRQLFARAKKAEAEVKAFKAQPKPMQAKKEPAQLDDDRVSKLVAAQLEKRELESLDLSDKVRKEVEVYSKINNVPVSKALKSDYIQFLKEKEEKDLRNDEASLGTSRKSSKKDYSTLKPADFDLRTPEGLAAHAKWEDAMRKQLG